LFFFFAIYRCLYKVLVQPVISSIPENHAAVHSNDNDNVATVADDVVVTETGICENNVLQLKRRRQLRIRIEVGPLPLACIC
jgi:hypothetical protein